MSVRLNRWLQNSIKNILPLSEEKSDFNIAVKEWFFTGELVDHGLANAVCELCEKGELRYHFQISNNLDNSLWIGSSCIERFDISVYDESGKEVTENKEAYLLKQVKHKHVLNALKKLAATNPQGTIGKYPKIGLDQYCISAYNANMQFDAKMLNYLFLRFEEEGIVIEKKFFSVSIRSEYNKYMLQKLKKEQYNRIRPALTIAQRECYGESRKQAKSNE